MHTRHGNSRLQSTTDMASLALRIGTPSSIMHNINNMHIYAYRRMNARSTLASMHTEVREYG